MVVACRGSKTQQYEQYPANTTDRSASLFEEKTKVHLLLHVRELALICSMTPIVRMLTESILLFL